MSNNIKPKPRLHAGHMEVAVANLIGYRMNTIVPNVSWGLNLNHECDLLILDTQNRFTEVEIKISLADLKADALKWHKHSSKIISRLVYAIPFELLDKSSEHIPKECGIISVKFFNGRYVASWYRIPRHDKSKQKPDINVISKFKHLGCMRIWALKTALHNK